MVLIRFLQGFRAVFDRFVKIATYEIKNAYFPLFLRNYTEILIIFATV